MPFKFNPFTDKLDLVGNEGPPAGFVETLTGNSGGAVSPDGSQNINVVGDGTTINVAGNPGTSTLTISTIGSGTMETLTGNTGGPISPVAGNTNTIGTGSITIAGAGNTLTAQLTGLTNHAILIGGGTATITNVGPSAPSGQVLQSRGLSADPSFSTATYPTTTGINQILYSVSTNSVAGLTTANQGVLTTGVTGIPVITPLATNGQLIIGSTAGAPAAATLSAGTGVSITNGSNSITISASGGGLTWTDVTGATQTIAASNGYLADRGGGVTFTLPASGTIGDVFSIVGVQGSWTLAQNANQQIKYGSSATTTGVGGSLASTNAGDCVALVATNTSASTVWRVMSSIGNITVV